MKILFISHDARLYGATRSLLNLVQGIRQQYPAVEMHVLIPGRGIFQDELNRMNIPHTVFPYHWAVTFYKERPGWKQQLNKLLKLNIRKNVKQFPSLMRLVRSINPDIIYTNTSVVSVGAWLALWLRKPHVWHIREFGWEDHRFLYDCGTRFRRWLYNRSALIVVISDAIKQTKLQNLKVPVKKIYNGVYSEKELIWGPREIAAKDRVVFGIIGGLRASKGILDAMQAFSQVVLTYPECRLIIAGGEEEYSIAALKAVAEKLAIKNQVEFTGFVSDTEQLYKQIDILLSCSVSEGLGRSIIEALAHGIPVISRNTGGAPELVQDNMNGFLFDTVQQLSDRMLTLAGSNLYPAFSKKALQQVKENLTLERYTTAIMTELEAVSK